MLRPDVFPMSASSRMQEPAPSAFTGPAYGEMEPLSSSDP